MNKMLLAVGFLAGVNIVSGCDRNIQHIDKHIFDDSGVTARYFEYDNKSDTMICHNMIPEDFKKCPGDLYTASILEFESCNFGDGIACENAWKLTFKDCPQIKSEISAHFYVGLWHYRHDAEIIIN